MEIGYGHLNKVSFVDKHYMRRDPGETASIVIAKAKVKKSDRQKDENKKAIKLGIEPKIIHLNTLMAMTTDEQTAMFAWIGSPTTNKQYRDLEKHTSLTQMITIRDIPFGGLVVAEVSGVWQVLMNAKVTLGLVAEANTSRRLIVHFDDHQGGIPA